MKDKYVALAKYVGAGLLVFGAAMIILPDLFKLFMSLWRMIVLITAIVGGALGVTLFINYLKGLWKSSQQSKASQAKEQESQARNRTNEQPHEYN